MNRAKAGFFDSQVNEPWAASQFGEEERARIDRMLRHANLGTGSRVIEPGCGTGRLTEILSRAVGPTGLVLALDISSKMVEAARSRNASRYNVSIECGSVEGRSFDSRGFDLVICHNVFPHFDDKPAAVSHLTSALRIGGKFVVFHFMNSRGINDLHRKADPSVLHDLMPQASEMTRIFGSVGLEIETIQDDDGYLLSSTRLR